MHQLKDLLLFEEHPDLLSFTFDYDNVLMWPFVRSYLYRSIAYPSALYTSFDLLKDVTLTDKIKFLYHTIKSNPLRMYEDRKFDILMFNSGVTNIEVNSKYFNRVSDYFSMMYTDQTLMIEDSYKREFKSPRAFDNIAYHDIVNLKSLFYAKLHRLPESEKENIQKFIEFIQSNFPVDIETNTLEHIRNILSYTARRLKPYHDFYRKIFEKYSPKLIFLEDASYGQRSYIIKWAKEYGIKVAELQHGLVSSNHEAYCYAKTLIDSKLYRQYVPDYFLSYGEYWNESIAHPSESIVIGNPHFSTNLRQATSAREDQNSKIRIMFLTAVDLDNIFPVVKEIIGSFDNNKYEIVVRPHPFVRQKATEMFEGVCEVDLEDDLYISLAKFDIIVGDASTVLFEAIGLGKRVFALDNAYADVCLSENAPIERFSTAIQLRELIEKNKNIAVDKNTIEYLWADDWQSKFKSFMKLIEIDKEV